MKKRMLWILAVLLVIVVAFTGCGEGVKIRFNTEAGFYGNDLSAHPTFTELVRTTEELQYTLDEYGLIDESQKYGEEYFADKALVLCLFVESSISVTHRIDSVVASNEKLVINFTRFVPQICADAIKECSFLIEVKKVDVADISDVQTVRKERTK